MVVALVLAGSLSAHAASFDCKLAKSPIEKAICSNAKLSAQDDQLAALYKRTRAAMPPSFADELRDDQRRWLHRTQQLCTQRASQQELQLVACLTEQYGDQLQSLDRRVQHIGGVTFYEHSHTVLAKDDPGNGDFKDEEENPGFGTLSATWPEAASADPQWQAWNRAVLIETQSLVSSNDENDTPQKPTGVWQSAWAQDSETDLTATVTSVTPQLVATSIGAEFDGHGAAHPSESYETFYWMLQQQRPLRVSDIFADSRWIAIVTARCRASLKAQFGADYDDYGTTKAEWAKTLHDVIVDPKNWTIDAKGLTIDYPEYTVAPRMDHPDGATVPWSALRAYLAPGFVVPK